MSLGGRPSERRRLATGGRPQERLASAVADAGGTVKPGSVNVVQIFHHDGCPCLHGYGMSGCTCEIVEVGQIRELRRGRASK